MNHVGSNHLTFEQRELIQFLLNKNMKCKDIAAEINKDERTVSKEVRNRRNRTKNAKYGLYNKKDNTPCRTLNRFPYVCNACGKKYSCFKEFRYNYDAKLAQENYEIILKDSRIGLDVTPEDKQHFDEVLKDGVEKGQSIYHIVNTNKDSLRYSVRSAYRIVRSGQSIILPVDLRRSARLKPRKHYVQKEDNKAIRKGRTYKDFLTYMAKDPLQSITELDTVESVRNGQHKCLLTIHNTATHFMIVIVLEHKTKKCVTEAILKLRDELGLELFKKLFRVTLTDRGSEFCDPAAIEVDFETGEMICRMFYCNSYSSYQKGAIEENHELIRYYIPKSTVFDYLTQDQANLMASHINSYIRDSIEGTPAELAKALFGEEILKKTKIREISPDSVVLNSSLFYTK